MAERILRFVVQIVFVLVTILVADHFANSLTLVPSSFVKRAELSTDQLIQLTTIFLIIHALCILALTIWRPSPWSQPVRFVIELVVAVCATSIAGVTMFVFTMLPFNPNFYLLIYLFLAGLYVVSYLIVSAARRSLTGTYEGGLGGAIGACLQLAINPWMWLALLVAITPGLLAVGYKKNRDLADAINAVRAAVNYETTDSWELGDLAEGVAFDQPMQAVFDPNDKETLFYLSRPGRLIRTGLTSDSEPTVLIDLVDEVASINAELGALSFALHPEFGKKDSDNGGFVYLWYTQFKNKKQYNRLARFDLSGETLELRNASKTMLIDVNRRTTGMHNGGTLQFGPDGFLYLSVGDANMNQRVQKINDSLLSGILRLDVDQQGGDVSSPIKRQPNGGTTANYYIPKDNPWYGRPETLEEFWAIGFRNPFRMWIDPQTGDAWVGDVGFEAWEEITHIQAGGNAQWDYREGPATTRFQKPKTIIGKETPPTYTYRQTAMDRAALGGFIYRGEAHPQLYGLYLFVDNNSGVIRSFDPTQSDPESTILAQASQFGQQGPTSMGLTPDGRILITVVGSKLRADGQIQTLNPTDGAAPGGKTGATDVAEMTVPQKYVMVCARCHGEDGRGMPELGESEILPKRPDFASVEWQKLRDDVFIKKAILDGGPAVGLGPHMPPWRGFLSEDEADAMVKHLRAFGAE